MFKWSKILLLFSVLAMFTLAGKAANVESTNVSAPRVAGQIAQSVINNSNWKLAFLTGKQGQVVFMSVSPETNPKNEIGMEVHPFDQVIILIQGSGKAILDGKEFAMKAGDLIFIPQGVHHNIINGSQKIPLKLMSFYSGIDIPAAAVYKTKADAK